jgi:hypothetical protein
VESLFLKRETSVLWKEESENNDVTLSAYDAFTYAENGDEFKSFEFFF